MRTTTGALDSAHAAAHVVKCMFIEFQFTSGTQRYTTAGHSIFWSPNTYVGLGNVISIEEIRESESLEAIGLRLGISGVSSSNISLARTEAVQGKTCRIWDAALDPTTRAIVSDPVLEFQGRIDTLDIEDSGDTCQIAVNIESRMADFARPNIRRFNDADQQKQYAGDLFFQFVPQMAEKTLVWPSVEFFR